MWMRRHPLFRPGKMEIWSLLAEVPGFSAMNSLRFLRARPSGRHPTTDHRSGGTKGWGSMTLEDSMWEKNAWDWQASHPLFETSSQKWTLHRITPLSFFWRNCSRTSWDTRGVRKMTDYLLLSSQLAGQEVLVRLARRAPCQLYPIQLGTTSHWTFYMFQSGFVSCAKSDTW